MVLFRHLIQLKLIKKKLVTNIDTQYYVLKYQILYILYCIQFNALLISNTSIIKNHLITYNNTYILYNHILWTD